MNSETSVAGESLFKRQRKGARRYSCAECRRLKLKCDRSIPCGSCVKRQCAPICPDGSLTTGKGNRFVLASTPELHEKIGELCNRVRHLEDALRAAHSQLSCSTEPHPLLTEELLKIKAPLQRELKLPSRNGTSDEPKDDEPNPDVVDAFGSLAISISGRTKYFGHTANSWYFLQNELPEDDTLEDQPVDLVLSPEILARSAAFPISPAALSSLQSDMGIRNLLIYLPTANKAAELRSIFYRYAAWMYNPISQESFNEQVFSAFYETDSGHPLDDRLLPHRQALLFMVLAIGSLMDLSQPPYNLEAERYHQLARATLFSNSIFEEPTVHAVQTLYLMSFYLFLADRHGTGSGSRWAIMGLAIKLAQNIGLHRDSGRWKVDPTETKRRRELFWELYTYDSWQCLTFGRPPSFSLAHIDCQLPHAQDTSEEQSYHSWKHRFTSECMSIVHDQAFGAKTPTYATIRQLDNKIRMFPVPPILNIVGFGSSEPQIGGFRESTELILQRHIVLAIREMNLLYLHRAFFARAVSDYARDPLESPHGNSVLAAYGSARSFIALMRDLYAQLKEPSERLWFLWTHMFSCAIVLGSVVTRCPSIRFAPSALGQLDAACDAFSKVARGFRAQKVLAIMLRLQEKAHISLDNYRKGKSSTSANQPSPGTSVNGDDELDTLGGKTRLVSNKESSLSPQLMNSSPTTMMAEPSVSVSSPDDSQVHPCVVYMQPFENHQPLAGPSSHSRPTPPYENASLYGIAPISLPHHDQTSYHHLQLQAHQQYEPETQAPYLPMAEATQLPQYLPVYGYTPVGLQNGYHPMQTNGIVDANPPEGNMHKTWEDFVAGFGMN